MQLKSTKKKSEMLFTKVEAISNSLCKGLGILLCCTLAKIRLLYIARTFSRSPFSKKHFIFLKLFLNSSGSIWQGKLTGKKRGGRVREDSSPGKTQPGSLLQTQNLRKFSLHYYYKHKTFDKKMLLNFSWCLTVSSIT